MTTSGLHDPYEDQLASARYRAERDALAQAMQRVADSMREHALGVEGMEDSPVAVWERELRAALGGLENIGTMIEYRRVLNGVCKRLGLTDGTGMPEQDGVIYEALERRLMPEGMEWMRWDDDRPVTYDDAPDDVIGVYIALDGSGYALMTDLPDQLMSEPSERVKRSETDSYQQLYMDMAGRGKVNGIGFREFERRARALAGDARCAACASPQTACIRLRTTGT